MLQLDLQKVYDFVNWKSLKNILKEIGFSSQFIRWIVLVVTIVSYRFIINGDYTKFMKAKRGPR